MGQQWGSKQLLLLEIQVEPQIGLTVCFEKKVEKHCFNIIMTNALKQFVWYCSSIIQWDSWFNGSLSNGTFYCLKQCL